MQQRVAVQLCPGATGTNIDISLHMNVVYKYRHIFTYECSVHTCIHISVHMYRFSEVSSGVI